MVNSKSHFPQPFAFQARTLSVPWLPEGQNSLHYVDEGQGPVLLCVHGNPTWAFYYRTVIAKLRQNYRVIAYDHLGCGFSSRPQEFAYTLKEHIRVLGFLVEQLQLKKISLFVHDWGGAVGLGWATQHPERLESLILSNTAAFVSQDIPWRIRLCKTPGLGEWMMRRCNAFALAAIHMATAKGLSTEQRTGLLKPYFNAEQRVGIARFVQDIPLSPSHPSYATLQDIENALPRLRCPKLMVWGMQDFCFHPGFLQRWQKIYPEAEVCRFPEAGHYLLEDAPEAVLLEVAKFLRQSVGNAQ